MIRVKICGITNLEDACAAIDAGADLLGFVFYPPSPRYVTPEQAQEIISVIRQASSVKRVGVFVNESPEHVRAVMETAGLDLAQLHGQETVDMVQALGTRAYKSLQPRDADHMHALVEEYHMCVNGNLPALLVDSPPQKLPGGNGIVANWELAAQIAREFPILLAGGLNADNVREAIERVQPWGVDVSSSVERAPGLKDHDKVREFIARVKTR